MTNEAKQIKSCQTCIGKMAKYGGRCEDCCEADNHMTKSEMETLKKQMKAPKN